MADIFKVNKFQFPYNYKFPGQASSERILYVTRENRLLLVIRKLFVAIVGLVLFSLGVILTQVSELIFGEIFGSFFQLGMILLTAAFVGLGWWWVTTTWKKSLAMVTTTRLMKFIYTTPVSRYSLALPLEMIVDTGAYTKGFAQTFLKLSTFIARSSASSSGVATADTSRINKKYFYIENIKCAEDLQHYVSKLLSAFRKQPAKLNKFRPFIADLKGEARAEFIKERFPEFWS